MCKNEGFKKGLKLLYNIPIAISVLLFISSTYFVFNYKDHIIQCKNDAFMVKYKKPKMYKYVLYREYILLGGCFLFTLILNIHSWLFFFNEVYKFIIL